MREISPMRPNNSCKSESRAFSERLVTRTVHPSSAVLGEIFRFLIHQLNGNERNSYISFFGF